MDSKGNVPYQTYRSKKHWRSQSSTPNASAAVTPDLQVNSYFVHAAPQPVPDSVLPQRLEPQIQPNIPENVHVHARDSSVSTLNGSTPDVKQKNDATLPTVVASAIQEKGTETPAAITDPSIEEQPSNHKQGTSDTPSTTQLEDRNNTSNRSDISATNDVVPNNATFITPTSTFRRLSSRARTTSEQSPLAIRPSSLVANSPSFRRVSNNSRVRVNSEASLVPNTSSRPVPPDITLPVSAPKVFQPNPVHITQPSSSSLLTNPPSYTTNMPTPQVPHSTPPSRPSSISTSSFPATRRSTSTLPYRPGFQPKGVYRQRTDEFLELRSSVRDKNKIETRRLERRLEKLIQLHFPPETTSEKVASSPSDRRSMSFRDIDLKRNPSEIWRDVVETRMQGSKFNIRAEEQHITPWQPDSEVSQCPHCSASFHPLTNRKHHCRLCGRVVCSLPLKHPTRKQLCSVLFIVDQKNGTIEEVGEGVDYGVRRRTSSSANPGEPDREKDDEKFLKGVRICKTCRTVLRRQQYLQEAARIPIFVRLHDTLINLEKEIEDSLRKFQDLIGSLSTSDLPCNTSDAPLESAIPFRKRLLESFASYDRLSKRIAQLPASKGGSQERIQKAVLSRANLFLQNNMVPLQSLPKFQPSPAPSPNPSTLALEEDKHLAETLQPLLEQETLLEGFIEEAKAQRKFEDARTLKANLEEIRGEIKRMASQAGAS